SPLRFTSMEAMSGELVWKVRSTPSPEEILRTMNEELRPLLRLAITMPSKACERLRSPSTTLTLTITVSPGEKSGTSFFSRLISSCSRVLIRSIASPLLFALELVQQLPFLVAQLPCRQQVRPSQPGPAQRLLQPPAPDVLVVPGHQDLRHLHAPIRLRARVLRAVEQPVGERLLHRRGRVAERPGQLPHHGVDQRHGGELAAREDEVSDRDLFVHPLVQQPLVHALISPAQQSKRILRRKFHYFAVIELLSLRREVDHPSARRIQRLLQRLGQHHHPRAAAVRALVDRAVVVGREVARIPRLQRPQPRFECPAGYPSCRERRKHLGKQCHRAEADHQSAPHSTSIRRFGRSTLFTTVGTQGNSRSRSPASSITSCAPFVNSLFTMPSYTPASFTTSRPTRSAR